MKTSRLHIAFFSFPHFSDVNPTISVVAALARRGCRVTYVTSDRFASAVSDAGAEFVRCPPFRNPYDPAVGWDEKHQHPSIPLALQTLDNVTEFYEANRPDLILYDIYGLSGRILADRWNIPAIQTSPAFGFDRTNFTRQVKAAFQEEQLTEGRDINLFLKNYGIEGDYPFFRERLNIFFYPKLFQLPGYIEDGSSFYAGRCAAERPYQRKWQGQKVRGRPTVLVSTSTGYIQGPDYFRMCISALTGLGRHVILAIGDNNDPAMLDPLPPHFEILQHIPQIEEMPYVDLLICLGGMTTTVEALYYGIPLLMMTHGRPEAETHADNNVRLGIGRHLEIAETNVENIRNCVLQMAEDTSLIDRVREMQRVVQTDPGAEETANRLFDYLDSQKQSVGHNVWRHTAGT